MVESVRLKKLWESLLCERPCLSPTVLHPREEFLGPSPPFVRLAGLDLAGDAGR